MKNKHNRMATCAAGLLITSAQCLTAASFNNGGGNLEFTNPLNWNPAVVPVASQADIEGTYNVVSNGNVTNTSRLLMGLGAGNNPTLTIQSGTLTFGGDGFNSANYVGVGGGSATMTLAGGNFTSTSGSLYIGGNGGATGVVNVNTGSTLTLQAGTLNVANNGNNTGTLNLNGGTVIAPGIYGGYSSPTGSSPNSNINIGSGSTLTVGNSNFGSEPTGVTNISLTVDAADWNTINWGNLAMGTGVVNLNVTLTGDSADWEALGGSLNIWNNSGAGSLSTANLTFTDTWFLDGTLNTTTGDYTFTIVPEPSAALLGGLGALALLRRRRA